MAVAPFDQTCATCHLDQIIGKVAEDTLAKSA